MNVLLKLERYNPCSVVHDELGKAEANLFVKEAAEKNGALSETKLEIRKETKIWIVQ